MGWHIVGQEASEDPKSYSRLWVPEDISQLLTGSEGTDKIEGIALNYQAITDVKVSSQAFTGMKNLRFLKFQNANASHGPNSLPHDLRWLDWHGYPSKSLPGSFKGERLVSLKMQYSHVIQLWKGYQDLYNLKFINLSHSQKLIRTPDFRGTPNLERLVLEECTSLTEIHDSVGCLNNLVILNLKNCINLKKLPKSICLEKLETLILSGCLKLGSFPEIGGPMTCLLDLYAEATALRELPSSIEFLTCLRLINLSYCKHLTSLPSSICGLKGLKVITLSGCSKFDKLPDELGDMECLEKLYCGDTAIQEVPPSISRLKKLNTLSISRRKPPASRSQYSFFHRLLLPATFQDTKASSLHCLSGLSSLVQLDLRDCSMLDGGIPFDLGALSSLELLNLSNNKFVSIPAEAISRLPKLVELFLVGCEKLETLPQLPSSLETVCLDECVALKGSIDSFTKYQNLAQISFTKCDLLLQDEGFALCVVSEMINTSRPILHYPNLGVRYGINAKCSLITPDGRKAYLGGGIGFMGIKQYMDSNITCLGYYSFEKWMPYLHINWVGSPNEWCQFEVSSEEGYSENIVHKGFGVRLIYEEDDVKQSDEAEMSQSSSSQFNPEASQDS
nr:TMV resistance protein N-like [Ipomoea batatas]